MGRMANILAVQEKLFRLIAEEAHTNQRVGASSPLQSAYGESLNWSDARLALFLEKTVRTRFGVVVAKKNIKRTMNGSSATIGDLAIAVILAIERQHKTGTLTLGLKT